MNELEETRCELRAITHELTAATEQIYAGISLDLSGLAPRAQAICERILRLPPEQSLSMLEEMTDAVEKLTNLTEKLKR